MDPEYLTNSSYPGICTLAGSSPYWYTLNERLRARIPVLLLALCSAYVTIMLILDTARAKRGDRRRKNKFAEVLMLGRLVAAFFTTVNLTFNTFSIFLEAYGSPDCNWFWKSENFMYWLNIAVIYVVLWLRQRAIYNEKSLRRIVSKATSVISYATLGLVVALPLINPIFFSTEKDFYYIEVLQACSLVTQGTTVTRPAIVAGEILVPVLLPVTLLGLFAWPLFRYNQTTDPNVRGQRSVLSALHRIVIATFVCLVTDMLSVAFNASCAVVFSLIFRNFSIISNLVCLIVSFTEWRDILFPMVSDSSLSNSDATTSSPYSRRSLSAT